MFEAGLKKTVDAYASIGTQLYIVEQIPQQSLGVKDLYYKIYASHNQGNQQKIAKNIRELSVSKQQHLQLQSLVHSLFKQQVPAGHLNLINFDEIYCNNEKCLIGTDKQSYYFDNNHLSTTGGRLVVDELVKHIQE